MLERFFPAPEIELELRRIHAQYAALVAEDFDAERGLGGRLLWTGMLDETQSRLLRASAIAGAAALAATAEAARGKQALREGVVDFLVTTLDEALRILKNEIRKRQPVAVCVLQSADAVRAEMLERGVLPDLLPADPASEDEAFLAQGAQRLTAPPDSTLAVFQIPLPLMPRTAEIDALLREALNAGDEAGRRWLRMATRYLPAQMRRVRALALDAEARMRLEEQLAGFE
jgi:enoyl-CoA hydratase/carnithine racemase